MKTIKNLLISAAVGLATLVGIGEAAHAGQPITWTLQLTNASLLSAAVSTVTSNGISGANTSGTTPLWTAQGAVSSNYVDTLQSSTGTISTWFNFTPTGLGAGNTANNVTTYFVGSQDLTTWVPWTNSVAANIAGTTNQFASWTKLDLVPFRYIAPSAIIYSVTNAYCTNAATLYTNQWGMVSSNSNIGIKIQLKGP